MSSPSSKRTTLYVAALVASMAPYILAAEANYTSDMNCIVCNGIVMDQYLRVNFDNLKDFESLKDTFTITDTYQWPMGAKAPDGATCYGKASNLKIVPGEGLQMTFAGSSATDKNMTGAEIYFDAKGKGMTGFYAVASIKSTDVPGTSQALLSYELDASQPNADEVDYEILGAQIAKADGGLRLTTHEYKNGTMRDDVIAKWSDHKIDQTLLATSYNQYALGWGGGAVVYKFGDGTFLKGSSKFVPRPSVPAKFIINHGTNGDASFYGAPRPTADANMFIKTLDLYWTSRPLGASSGVCQNYADVCKPATT